MAYTVSNLEPLINFLRLHIGDTGTSPTYSDEILHESLRYSIVSLGKRWNNKYYIDNNGVAQRNGNYSYFNFASPPVIERSDHRPIILQASIIIKSGQAHSGSGDAISFRDDEFSYDARDITRQRTASLERDIAELERLLPIKLAGAKKRRLIGYKNVSAEYSDWD